MKHCIRLLVASYSRALLLLYSCERDDYNLNEYENPGSLLILEARNYFEEYVSIEMEGEPTALHPGNIAPEWDKAKVFFHSGAMAVNVPLITEATYEGSFIVMLILHPVNSEIPTTLPCYKNWSLSKTWEQVFIVVISRPLFRRKRMQRRTAAR